MLDIENLKLAEPKSGSGSAHTAVVRYLIYHLGSRFTAQDTQGYIDLNLIEKAREDDEEAIEELTDAERKLKTGIEEAEEGIKNVQKAFKEIKQAIGTVEESEQIEEKVESDMS